MCEQCLAKTVMYVGPDKQEVLPDYFLVRATQDGSIMKKDDWGIVKSNSPDYIWSITPVSDPCDGLSEEQEDALPQDSFEEFYKAVENLEEALDSGGFDCAIHLGRSMTAAGYNPEIHGYRSAYWLCNHLAKFLKTAKVEK